MLEISFRFVRELFIHEYVLLYSEGVGAVDINSVTHPLPNGR
jgi:hypothetical protein